MLMEKRTHTPAAAAVQFAAFVHPDPLVELYKSPSALQATGSTDGKHEKVAPFTPSVASRTPTKRTGTRLAMAARA